VVTALLVLAGGSVVAGCEGGMIASCAQDKEYDAHFDGEGAQCGDLFDAGREASSDEQLWYVLISPNAPVPFGGAVLQVPVSASGQIGTGGNEGVFSLAGDLYGGSGFTIQRTNPSGTPVRLAGVQGDVEGVQEVTFPLGGGVYVLPLTYQGVVGFVSSKSGSPLQGVTVQGGGLNIDTRTDPNGFFDLQTLMMVATIDCPGADGGAIPQQISMVQGPVTVTCP
jgi:hypothetical protein